MRVLIAEDDADTRLILEMTLRKAGYDVVLADDGDVAWTLLSDPEGPTMAILDWNMPGRSGLEICREIREAREPYIYVILVTAMTTEADILKGFRAGVDDYITKPFRPAELLSRLRVGDRILALETSLASRVGELQEALDHVELLQGLLPMCMHCKKIRDEEEVWTRLEDYFERHDVLFTHSLCEECMEKHYGDELEDAPE